jgi:probable selenium-dependent hydroxylase accessory protein YqeC
MVNQRVCNPIRDYHNSCICQVSHHFLMISSLTQVGFSDKLSSMSLYDLLLSGEGSAAALIGGGGKTSLMARIAEESIQRNLPVILSTTTKLRRPCPIPAAKLHIGSSSPEPASFNRRGRPVLWVGGEYADGDKWIGPPREALEACIEESPAIRGGAVLVEADGSAGRPVKAPGSDEPVIPRGVTTVAAVIGLSALGRPVSEMTIHRMENFLRITGASPGEVITPELLIRLIVHPEGSFKAVPPGIRRLLIINQVDSDDQLPGALALGESALTEAGSSNSAIAAAVVTCLRHNKPIRSIISI